MPRHHTGPRPARPDSARKKCRSVRFSPITGSAPKSTGSARAWPPKMAAPCLPAAARGGAGSSPSATSEPCSVLSTSQEGTPTSNDSSVSGFAFGPERRIQKSSEFRLVYDTGRKLPKANFVAFCLRRADDLPTRVGFTTPRALGKAVLRNRVRRRIREAIRLNLWRLPTGWSLVFNPRRVAATRPFEEIVAEVEQVLARCAASSS